ncbi:MAG TPA: twin-arginine translocase TatA/TatE family subunit [Candidatus Nitrosotalea sp.]|nr:twin-arginine translocase TatA/TatE family subunit [Candidatus Nitrosotalea sp.]
MIDFALTIMGNDWIVIAFVALVMLLGTKRMPEASRKLGKIVGEFNKTKSTVQDEIRKAKGDFNPLPIEGPAASERQKLEIMAKTLGIDSANKTDEDLRTQIFSKLGAQGNSGGSEKQEK